jgi:DNA-binding transcriptional regulator YhcF (GntR family)/DNA-binding LacI/PurR family transcriptional regulator
MPSRKAEKIAQVLREEILSGRRAPCEKLPTYDALIEQFRVTRPTVARIFRSLRKEGLIEANGTRGLFVAASLPHHHRYLWVTSEQPGSPEWTTFLATILDLIEKGETGIDGEVVALVGVDGRANNPEYQRLCEAVDHGSVAGLFLMNSAAVYLLPALQSPGIPRVAIWAPLPHAGLLSLDFNLLLERACDRVLQKGKRVAVMSPHAPNLERAQQYLSKTGLAKDRIWALHVAAVGCDRITELLLDRRDRPDALFVTDDNLVAPLLSGFKRAKVRPGKDVYVLAHCNWPHPVGAAEGVEHIGFDVREVLVSAKECIDEQRGGQAAPGRTVPPRFAHELLHR